MLETLQGFLVVYTLHILHQISILVSYIFFLLTYMFMSNLLYLNILIIIAKTSKITSSFKIGDKIKTRLFVS